MDTGLLNLLVRRIIIIKEKKIITDLMYVTNLWCNKETNSGNIGSTGGSLVAAFNRWMRPKALTDFSLTDSNALFGL
jgi:hypothetical protein